MQQSIWQYIDSFWLYAWLKIHQSKLLSELINPIKLIYYLFLGSL